MKTNFLSYFIMFFYLFFGIANNSFASESFNINIKNSVEGAPITLGVPFPVGALASPDNIRLVDFDGNEIPSQITEVSRWLP